MLSSRGPCFASSHAERRRPGPLPLGLLPHLQGRREAEQQLVRRQRRRRHCRAVPASDARILHAPGGLLRQAGRGRPRRPGHACLRQRRAHRQDLPTAGRAHRPAAAARRLDAHAAQRDGHRGQGVPHDQPGRLEVRQGQDALHPHSADWRQIQQPPRAEGCDRARRWIAAPSCHRRLVRLLLCASVAFPPPPRRRRRDPRRKCGWGLPQVLWASRTGRRTCRSQCRASHPTSS